MHTQEAPRWNLLVLSDLHLGDQLPGESRASVRQSAHFLAHHLGAFLDYYATHREQDLPWRLVIAGDMIDFMRIHIPAPTEERETTPNALPQTNWERPPNHLRGALLKLEQVFALHRHTFERIGHFLLAGNELIMVTGNHDAELNWCEVQEAFRTRLTELMFASDPSLASHPFDHFDHSVRFMPWFYYEPDRIYIEHGHLYDRYCSVENALTLPTERDEEELLSFSHFASDYQYRSEEAFSGLPLEHLDQWSIWDITLWIAGRPMRQKYLLLMQILGLIWRLVSTAWIARYRQASVLPETEQQAVFRQIANAQELPVEAIQPLKQFMTPPIHTRFFDSIQALYLDRMALVAITVAITVVSLVAPWSALLRAAILTLTATGFVAAYMYLAHRHPVAHSAPALMSAATRIASYLQAPLIVFGHSHEFERHWLCHNQLYINLGSWLAPAESAQALLSMDTAPLTPPSKESTDARTPPLPASDALADSTKIPPLLQLPNTPPCSIPSVQPFETPYLIMTYQQTAEQGQHKAQIAHWQSHSTTPIREDLPLQKADVNVFNV